MEKRAYHDLVANAMACAKEPDAMLLGKRLNLFVLPHVAVALVLDVVIEGKDKLRRVLDLGRAGGHEARGGQVLSWVRHRCG